ncbi:MAG: hypothetical protein E7508_04730 [Ruminococcus sp.]|nr:hypothetical protein [Ruminococcus sp.]
MSKMINAVICLLILFSSSGCQKSYTSGYQKSYTVGEFSYTEDALQYTEDIPGVELSGFKNTMPCELNSAEEAVELAKNEVTVGYNQISVCYDESEKVWAVLFYTSNMAGGCQTVYIDNNGITLMCVYGE